MNKKLLKPFIASFKVVNLYGDKMLIDDGFIIPFRGKALRVKILGLFYFTYYEYNVKIKYE